MKSWKVLSFDDQNDFDICYMTGFRQSSLLIFYNLKYKLNKNKIFKMKNSESFFFLIEVSIEQSDKCFQSN